MWKQGGEAEATASKVENKVVFFQHGFLQDSESWVAKPIDAALPYLFVDMGYDVWLGNNRGNKYSYKNTTLSPRSDKFWDFCIDNFALGDIPTMVNYALATSGAKTLTYIGFSQGTAQGFAGFSMQKELAAKINLFVALAPATVVKKLNNQVAAALTTSKPNLVYLLFGKKAVLKQTYFWRKVLTKSLFVWVIDRSVSLLFGWSTAKIAPKEKPMLYSHIYSFSSVKTIVHWFQITNTQLFQMYDDNIITVDATKEFPTYLLPSYPVAEIKCPVAVFYGGRDTLPDNQWLLKRLPATTYVHKEEEYEHLDFLWAYDVREKIYDKVIALVEKHNPLTA
jgi:lysosomal acid lipase/cholesteryl ester hydrolase